MVSSGYLMAKRQFPDHHFRGEKFCLRRKGKTLLGIFKECWHHPAMFCLINSSKFPANNLNFYWRWWDWIQAIVLDIFYFDTADFSIMLMGFYISLYQARKWKMKSAVLHAKYWFMPLQITWRTLLMKQLLEIIWGKDFWPLVKSS